MVTYKPQIFYSGLDFSFSPRYIVAAIERAARAVARNPAARLSRSVAMGGPTKMRIDLSRGIIELECEQETFQTYLKEVREFVMDVSSKRQAAEMSDDSVIPVQVEPTQLALLSSELADRPRRVAVELTSQELKDFVGALNLRESEMEYVLAFSYYLTEKRGWLSVSQRDIEECYRLYGRPVPRIDKAVGNASYRYSWLARDKQGNIVLTREGKNYIEFPENRREKTAKVSGKVKGSPSPKPRGKSNSAPIEMKVRGDLDVFGGDGRPSFAEFAAKKNPSDNKDRIAVSAYYLLHILGLDSFNEQDVFTCYTTVGWRPPEFLRNNIINHKNKYGFYMFTDDKSKFLGTLRLKNHVEFDMQRNAA